MDRSLELYNLMDDIGETKNLLEANREKSIELITILSDFLRETRAGMSIDKSTGKTVEYPDEVMPLSLPPGHRM